MCDKKRSTIVRVLALMIVLALMVPAGANAAVVETVQPCASYYLNSYNAYVWPAGSGKVQVWFTVKGTGYMDDIGTLTIKVYESTDNSTWYWVKSFSNGNYPNMLAQDDYSHCSYVEYQGVAGRYYKAYVCVWAGKDGGGDTRYFWTSAKLAT